MRLRNFILGALVFFIILCMWGAELINIYHPEWMPKVQSTYVETYVDPDTGVNYLIYNKNGEVTMCPKYDENGNLIISADY